MKKENEKTTLTTTSSLRLRKSARDLTVLGFPVHVIPICARD